MIPIVTLAASTPERRHIAMEEETADERRLAGMRAHFARRPWATWVILSVIVLMFVLEEALGGSENDVVLVRLGAWVAGEIQLGAWWRLVSAGFLHAGLLHVGFNGYALWIVGSSVERILGTARFLVVYTVSLLVGGLASLVLSNADVAVGASGAIFGLFGVEAIVVFLRPDLLPSHIRQTHGRNVLVNLAINVIASFQPNIGTVAHFAGGLAGAALALVFVPHRFELHPTTPSWARSAAVVCALLLATGLGYALFRATQSSGEVAVLGVM